MPNTTIEVVPTTATEQRFLMQLSEARNQFAQLCDMGKSQLEAEYRLSHQVYDTSGSTRMNIVYDILRGRFSDRVVDSL